MAITSAGTKAGGIERVARLITKVNDQLKRALGEHTLGSMVRHITVVIPEPVYEPVERRSGAMLDEVHAAMPDKLFASFWIRQRFFLDR